MVNHQPTPATPADNDADLDIGSLLSDAYDAPAVPRSLLRRLDRQIAEDWGKSPELVAPRWGLAGNPFADRTAWRRFIPAVATAAVLIVGVLVLGLGSAGSVWAEVLEAVRRQGVAEVEIPGGTRWMSLSERVVIEQQGETVALWDFRRNMKWTRQAAAGPVQRAAIASQTSLSDSERTALAFLVGPSRLAETPGLRITDEQTEPADAGRGEVTALNLSLAGQTGAAWTLRIAIDPESLLPEQCKVVRGRDAGELLALSYPPASLQEFQTRTFPELPSADDRASATLLADDAAAGAATGEASLSGTAVAAATTPRRLFPAVPWQSPDAVPSRWDAVDVQPLTQESLVARIDALLEDIWQAQGIEPTTPADDTELLRRVYLDLTGRTPTVHEVRSYLNAPPAQRYPQLVDRLLNSPDHASHLATVWRKVLIPEGIDLTAFGGVQTFDRWLSDEFAARTPYDEIVSKLLLAEGRLSKPGPLLFYTALKLDPDQIASRTARAFLGMRLECAECHDHPFEPWTQQDFWGYAAFFAQISRPQGELQRASKLMRVRDVDHGEVMLPESDEVVPPKFLDGTRLDAFDTADSRREKFVRWLIDPANPYFARATANRVWGQLFGKGITDPIDNFGVQHKPRIPELVDLLAGHLIASDFQLSELLRSVVLSRAYRLSSGAEDADPQRLEWFAQMQVKMLTAEQMFDCISVATMLDNGQDPGNFNLARFSNAERDAFLQQFSVPAGSATDYQGGIPQALTLMNGTLITGATGLSSSGLLKSLEAPFFTNRERIEVLYLSTLSRPPRAAEWEILEQYLPLDGFGDELQGGLADLLWVLLNSAEFTMNH